MIKTFFIYLFLVGVSLNLLLWLTSPWLSTPLINQFLKEQKLSLSESSSIELNPFGLKVTLKDVVLNYEQNELLALSHAVIDINPLLLVNKQIRIESIRINGFKSSAQLQDEELVINGTPLSKLVTSPSQTAKIQEKQQEDNNEQAFDWRVQIDEILISDIDLTVKQNSKNLHLVLNELQFDDVVFNDNKLSLNQALEFVPAISDEEMLLDATATIRLITSLVLDLPGQHLSLDETRLVVSDFILNKNELQAKLQNLLININQLQLSNWQHQLQILLKFNLGLSQLELYKRVNNQILAQLQGISLKQFNLQGTQTSPVVHLASLTLNKLNLPSIDTEQPELLSLDKLQINSIDATETRTQIDNINIGKLYAHPVLSPDKTLANWGLPQLQNNKNDIQAPVKASGKDSVQNIDSVQNKEALPYQLTIKHINNTEDLTLSFTDLSVNPFVKLDAAIKQLNVENLTTLNSADGTKVQVAGTIQEYGKFNLTGQHQPFSEPAKHDIEFNLTELELPAFSAYVDQSLGYDINSGQMDTNIELKIIDNLIDGESVTLLKSIELTDIESTGEQDKIDTGAISFNMALGMLKDSDDNVELDIPIEGDLTNPSVGLSGIFGLVVRKATMMAAKDYLMTTFVPYSQVVSIALTAGETLLKMNFNDMPFEPGSDSLTPANQQYLSQLSEVLVKQPDLRLKVCAVSTLQDAQLVDGTTELNPGQQEHLLSLAKSRANNSKRWLVKHKNIESGRILICSAKIEKNNQVAGVLKIEQI